MSEAKLSPIHESGVSSSDEHHLPNEEQLSVDEIFAMMSRAKQQQDQISNSTNEKNKKSSERSEFEELKAKVEKLPSIGYGYELEPKTTKKSQRPTAADPSSKKTIH
ncbi:unnamed protein product [Ambrosiozyma monospora]|uniref:Unnamed protein product n=1 Tax=Ambrosiozyma monospora TaxID=43982 RepID=A0ACB5TXR6_AMBMO|nr:unnamed protein product [Ambrosiozyma monospora]